MSEQSERARRLAERRFADGHYCGESVVGALLDVFDGADDVRLSVTPKMATGFCSGMGRCGGTCGALSGGILVLSDLEGRSDTAQSVAGSFEAVQMLVDGFEDAFGTMNCTELLGCHLGTPEGQKTFEEQSLVERCQTYSGKAAELACEIIELRKKARQRG